MKKLILGICLSFTTFIFAQSPQGINYQAVVRDPGGNVIASSPVGIKVSIHQSSSTGTVVYSETFGPTTSAIGLVNLVIGQGTVVSGNFSTIDWGAGPYFCEIGLDPTGGTSYTSMGTQQFMSVPYALYAANGGTPGPTGATGPAGNDGVSVDTSYVNNDSLFVVLTSGQIINAGYVTGSMGPTGPAGSNGTNGTNGTNGLNGATWLTGSGVPLVASGVNNDLYLNTANGDYYLKVSGTWNLQGNLTGPAGTNGTNGTNGSNGTNGTDGATWLTGAGAPAGGSGNINDLYLNTTTGQYYLKTGVSTWTLQGNLTGPAGLLPNGTAAGNTPYWDGSTWVVNSSNIFNNGGNVGIGTASPQQLVHLHQPSAANSLMQVTNSVTGSTGYDGLTIGVNNAGNAVINFNEIGTLRLGTSIYSGIELSNFGKVTVGDVAGTFSGNYFYTEYSGTPRFAFMGANVGVGTLTPNSQFHVHAIGAVNNHVLVTNGTTGSTGTDGLAIGVTTTGDGSIDYFETGNLKININGNTPIWMNSVGHVGIAGTPDATQNLLVYGANPSLAVNSNSIIVGDVYGYSFGNYFLTDFENTPRFSFMGANVGIGTLTPAEQLDIPSGNVRISGANDYKYASAKTHYWSIPAAAFHLEATAVCDAAMIGGCIYTTGGSAATVTYFVAPIHLPDGATVTSFSVYQVDNDGTYNLQNAQLIRNDASTSTSFGNSVTMATTPLPASTNSTLIQMSTTSTISSPVIDNQNYFYWVRWGTQQANSNLRLAKMVISYTVTKVD